MMPTQWNLPLLRGHRQEAFRASTCSVFRINPPSASWGITNHKKQPTDLPARSAGGSVGIEKQRYNQNRFNGFPQACLGKPLIGRQELTRTKTPYPRLASGQARKLIYLEKFQKKTIEMTFRPIHRGITKWINLFCFVLLFCSYLGL